MRWHRGIRLAQPDCPLLCVGPYCRAALQLLFGIGRFDVAQDLIVPGQNDYAWHYSAPLLTAYPFCLPFLCSLVMALIRSFRLRSISVMRALLASTYRVMDSFMLIMDSVN